MSTTMIRAPEKAGEQNRWLIKNTTPRDVIALCPGCKTMETYPHPTQMNRSDLLACGTGKDWTVERKP